MTEKNKEHINRLWFDFYIKEIESSPKTGYKCFDNYFLCPCCHFPTLTERQGYETCLLCNWEDDGQDDQNADKVLGGPNQDYSLTEARQNFIKYLTSYRPTDTYHFERTTIKKSFDDKIIFDLTEIKKQIIEKYNLAMTTNNEDERKQIFTAVSTLESKLNS
jgi:hypothetical protein